MAQLIFDNPFVQHALGPEHLSHDELSDDNDSCVDTGAASGELSDDNEAEACILPRDYVAACNKNNIAKLVFKNGLPVELVPEPVKTLEPGELPQSSNSSNNNNKKKKKK